MRIPAGRNVLQGFSGSPETFIFMIGIRSSKLAFFEHASQVCTICPCSCFLC